MGNKESKADTSKLSAPTLFPELDLASTPKVRRYKRINHPIWTEHKSQFIRQYLSYFVQVTKHGAYIDGFAGPQSYEHLDAWCASLVLQNEPKWLRHFFLCEIRKKGAKALRRLAERERQTSDRGGRTVKRNIEVYCGDFNVVVDQVLSSKKVTQKEAAFCLLDQRTFECHWATLEKLASYKKGENKIELLYFLGVGWLHRGFSGIRHTDKMLRWWGNADWKKLISMRAFDIAELVRQRFQDELGYKYVAAYPIFDRADGNKVMYYMIHGSDHPEAPALMVRAHHKAVRALPRARQISFRGM